MRATPRFASSSARDHLADDVDLATERGVGGVDGVGGEQPRSFFAPGTISTHLRRARRTRRKPPGGVDEQPVAIVHLGLHGATLDAEDAERLRVGVALVAHAEDCYSEWGVSGSLRLVPGATGRGLSASLTPSYGVEPGASERLWMLPDAHAVAANDNAPLSRRLSGWGSRTRRASVVAGRISAERLQNN